MSKIAKNLPMVFFANEKSSAALVTNVETDLIANARNSGLHQDPLYDKDLPADVIDSLTHQRQNNLGRLGKPNALETQNNSIDSESNAPIHKDRHEVINLDNCLVKHPNVFFDDSSKLLLSDENNDADIALFVEQLAYIVVSQACKSVNIRRLYTSHDIKLKCNQTMLLAALLGTSSVLKKVAGTIGKVSQALRFPEEVLTCRKVLQDKYERRTFALNPSTGDLNWFDYALELKSKITFSTPTKQLIAFLFRQHPTNKAAVIFDYQNVGLIFQGKLNLDIDFSASEAPEPDMISEVSNLNKGIPSLFDTYQKAQQFKQYLSKNLIGQSLAIESVTEMVTTAFQTQKNGLLGIATFMGASGSGKTVLAETLASGLNEVFAANFDTLLLNMEMYSDEKSGAKLFGAGSQYNNAALGDLTSAVSVAPRTVIIFDEIEKAHPSVQQALLTVLEKGKLVDQTTNKTVDFSQCFIIFTTNLGLRATTKNTINKQQLDLKSLLTEKSGQCGLSPEFISRLSRGSIVLFENLSAKSLLTLAEAAANKARVDKSVQWPANFADIILESLGCDVEPRTIQTQAAKLQNKVLSLVCSSINRTNTTPRIVVECPEDLSNFFFTVVTKNLDLQAFFSHQYTQCSVLNRLEDLNTINIKSQAVLIDRSLLTVSQAIPVSTQYHLFSFGLTARPANYPQLERHFKLHNFTVESLHIAVQHAAKRTRLLTSLDETRQRKKSVKFEYHLSSLKQGFKVTLTRPIYEQRFAVDDFEPIFMKAPCIPTIAFKDVMGLHELKKSMSLILKRLQDKNDFVLNMPNGYLLAGAPGTGKSYFAKAVAGECQVPFIPVNAADLMDGCPIKNINHLFDVAERYAPCIVFLDEIDAIAINREASQMLSRLAVNTLLTRLDGFNDSQYPVFVLAATNTPQALDPAIVRYGRFDKVVNFSHPDQAILKQYIQQCAISYNFVLSDEELTYFSNKISGVSFGFIDTLFRDLQLNRLIEQRPFDASLLNDEINKATKKHKPEMNLSSTKTRLQIAYHETGHYLLHKLHFPKVACTCLSIQAHQSSGGVALFDFEDEDLTDSPTNIRARLQILLAGRAAEKLFVKHHDAISSGANHDIKQATQLAKFAITECGFSEKLALADYSQLPMLQKQVDDEIVEWLNAAYDYSEAYLQKNWSLVKYVAEALFENETLSQQTLDLILSQYCQSST
ncbi:AAA family ATPase [Rheinheimera sp. UJ51]|uniref:AAA family ATPase n=1 Tax=Rheinheimera sp. UJ51 TaxID=2892446 RepID=UPI001E60D2CE|nr:AAA family ATPase [Rheinheimera sp. UJ51]MCC5452918.1 AAA family ATPase [Rheinheimera sp. UJ51]